MLYLGKFNGDANPVLVGAPSVEDAIARIVEVTGDRPAELAEVPDALVCCEVRFADDGTEENPADETEYGVALDPFDDFAAVLVALDNEAIAPELAPTEPPAVNDGE